MDHFPPSLILATSVHGGWAHEGSHMHRYLRLMVRNEPSFGLMKDFQALLIEATIMVQRKLLVQFYLGKVGPHNTHLARIAEISK